MGNRKNIYFDSCCFIDLVKIGRGIAFSADEVVHQRRQEDCWFLSKLCDASRDGVLRIVTSMLAVVECTHVGDGSAADMEIKRKFEAFLTSGVVVDLVEPDLFVMEKARSLRWDHGLPLKPIDAVHVATSILHECVEFITTDKAIHAQGSRFNKSLPGIKKLGVHVIRGSQTSLLPGEYRMDDLLKPPLTKMRGENEPE